MRRVLRKRLRIGSRRTLSPTYADSSVRTGVLRSTLGRGTRVKYLGVLCVLVVVAAAVYKLGLLPTDMADVAEETAKDVSATAKDVTRSAKDKLEEAGVDLKAVGLKRPPREAVEIYERYAEALGEQRFARAEGLSVAAAKDVARQRKHALRTLEDGTEDRVYVAKVRQPKHKPLDADGRPLPPGTYDHVIRDFEVLDDGNVVKLDVVVQVVGGMNPGRRRHTATVVRIDGKYRVSEFMELRAPAEPPKP